MKGIKSYWARMSPEQRKQEMRHRMAVHAGLLPSRKMHKKTTSKLVSIRSVKVKPRIIPRSRSRYESFLERILWELNQEIIEAERQLSLLVKARDTLRKESQGSSDMMA